MRVSERERERGTRRRDCVRPCVHVVSFTLSPLSLLSSCPSSTSRHAAAAAARAGEKKQRRATAKEKEEEMQETVTVGRGCRQTVSRAARLFFFVSRPSHSSRQLLSPSLFPFHSLEKRREPLTVSSLTLSPSLAFSFSHFFASASATASADSAAETERYMMKRGCTCITCPSLVSRRASERR